MSSPAVTSPAHADMSTSQPPIAPRMDADVKALSPKTSDLVADLKKVDEPTLIEGLDGSELSLYEKKSLLINRELDRMNEGGFLGVGRYQWQVWGLCGFGYFLDLMFAQAFGLVLGPLKQELGVPNNRSGDMSASFSAGLTVGAFTWGILCDIIGRRWCFNITCLIASIFGLLFAAPSNYSALCFLTAMIGFGVGGNIPIDATITLEFLPNNRRFLLAWLSVFQPLGVVAASLIAWGLVPKYSCDTGLKACSSGAVPCCTKGSNMGWRYLMIVLGLISLFVFAARFFIFNLQESPKFLLSKGKEEEAIAVVHRVAAINKAPIPDLTIDDFRALDAQEAQRTSFNSTDEIAPVPEGGKVVPTKKHAATVLQRSFSQFKHLKGLFGSPKMIWLTISICLSYITLFFAFSITGTFLPLILRAKGIDTRLPIDETYRNYVIVKLPGIIAVILSGLLMEVKGVGRRYSMVFCAGMMGASLILFRTVDSVAGFVGLNTMEYFFQAAYAAILYASTPEFFPAPYRGSACGMAATLGRIAGIVAPLVAQTIYSPSSYSVIYLAGGAALVSMLCVATLPFETRGKQTF